MGTNVDFFFVNEYVSACFAHTEFIGCNLSFASSCSLRLAQTVVGLFDTSSLVTRMIMQHALAKFNVPNSGKVHCYRNQTEN